MERTFQFCVHVGLIMVRKYSGSCTGTQVTNVSPSSLSLGGIPEGYSVCTLGGIRGKQSFNGEELDVSQGCHRVYPGASSPHFVGRTRRDEYVTCVGKGQTKSDQEKKSFGVNLSTPPSRARRDASCRKRVLVSFSLSLSLSLLQTGASNSSLTPLNCILKNWDRFDPQA